MQSNFYRVDALPLLMGFLKRSLIKARSNKGKTLTEDEPSAAPDQTAGKQTAGEAATNKNSYKGGKPMLRSEAIEKYWGLIVDAMQEAYYDTIGGNTQEKIYIWEDGEIETLFGVIGDNSFLRPRAGEDRELFFVTTVSTADPADFIEVCTEHMTNEEYTAVYDEAAQFLVDGYNPEEELQNIFDNVIREEKAEAEEAEELRFYQ